MGLTQVAFADDIARQQILIKDSVDGLYYQANSDSTAIVTYGTEKYTGEKEIKSEVSLWTGMVAHVNGNRRKVYKTYKVVAVGDSAFLNCYDLTSVTIPESVTSIGVRSFYYCTSLLSVVIPNSVTSIGYRTFYGCSGLRSVTIGGSVTTIQNSFDECNNIKELIFADGCTQTPCTGITSITSVSIPNTVKTIGSYTFLDCSKLTSVVLPNSVTNIMTGAFSGCTGMSSIDIGDSVVSLGNNAFFKCNALKTFTIPASMQSISSTAFSSCNITELIYAEGCTTTLPTGLQDITSVSIPNSVKSIREKTFYNCRSLKSITLPDSITMIGSDAFTKCPAKIYANVGSYALLAMWNYQYAPYDATTGERLVCSEISTSASQTRATIRINRKYDGYVYIVNGERWDVTSKLIEGLTPGNSYNVTLRICKSVEDQTASVLIQTGYSTEDIYRNINTTSTASSISVISTYSKGDFEVVSQNIIVNGKTYDGATALVTGLEPNTSYRVEYDLTIKNGSKVYTRSKTVTTQQLTLTTKQPKVVTEGNVVVQAASNLDDAETNVGFEWRRTDWSEDFASNSGKAYLYEGAMEGYIRNLNTNFLFRYRPYYQSSNGTMYYGDWVGIDPTNTSYFEPTVHTYASVSVNGNSAMLKGYAQRGTETLATRGFAYWKKSATSSSQVNLAPSIPTGAQTVTVALSSNNPVLETTLTDLDYETEYSYVTFVTTSENETFYGETQTFTTGKAPTLPQDVTRNGIVDTQDVLQIYEYMRTPAGEGSPIEDVNADGNVDTQDVLDVYEYIRGK